MEFSWAFLKCRSNNLAVDYEEDVHSAYFFNVLTLNADVYKRQAIRAVTFIAVNAAKENTHVLRAEG